MEARIKETGVAVAIIVFVFIATGIFCSVHAQPKNQVQYAVVDQDQNHNPNRADEVISHATSVHLTAKATALNTSINGPFSELKPAIAPNGKRLYFSRFLHPDNTHGHADYEDIWYSEFDETTAA